jgi:hypothetical protein
LLYIEKNLKVSKAKKIHNEVCKKKKYFIYWFLYKPKSVGTFLFLIMSAIVTIFIFSQYQIVKEKEPLEMKNILNAVNNNIENSLKNSYNTVLSLALTINDNGIPENFNYYASQLLKSNPNISAVQLVPN